MNKFKFLVLSDLKKVIKKKSFIIINVIVFIVLLVLLNIPNWVGGSEVEEVNVLITFDDDNLNNDKIFSYLEEINAPIPNLLTLNLIKAESDYQFMVDDDLSKEEFINSNNQILLKFSKTNDADLIEVEMYYNKSSTSANQYLNSLLIGLKDYLNEVESIPFSPNKIINLGLEAEDKMLKGIMVAVVVSIPIFSIIIMGFQMCGTSIIGEKSSKAIETIISSVPAKTHFYAKITFSVLFVLIQSLLLFLSAIIGFFISNTAGSGELSGAIASFGFETQDLLIIGFFVISFIVVGTLSYLLVGALIASMANSAEDYQAYQTPLMITLLAAFYMALYLPQSSTVGYTILRVFSYLPFFSTIIAPVSYGAGIIYWWEAVISLSLSLASFLLISRAFAPIYKISILNYEQGKFFEKIKKAYNSAKINKKKEKKHDS